MTVFTLSYPAWADDNAEANRLFVEAMQAWKQSEQLTADSLENVAKRVELLRAIEAKRNRIVARHSSSNLAVHIMLGPVGPLDLDRLPLLLEEAAEKEARFLTIKQIEVSRSKFSEGYFEAAQRALIQALFISTQEIEDLLSRTNSLASIVRAQVATADLAGALQTVQKIENAQYLSWALA